MGVLRTVATGLLAVLLVVSPVVPAFAAGGTLTLTSGLSVNSGPLLLASTVPSGQDLRWILNYTCSNAACGGGAITLQLPTGVQTGIPSFSSSDVTSVASTATSLTFTMTNPLPAGATGQIGLPITVPGGTTPNGTTFTLAAQMTSIDAGNPSPAPLVVTVQADVITEVRLVQRSGGAVGSSSTFAVSTCLYRVAVPEFGPLAVQAGSRLVTTLPPGATFLSASGGGTYAPAAGAAPATVTWSFPSVINEFRFCQENSLLLRFDAADNAVGESKTLQTTWTGSPLGTVGERTLGTAELILVLVGGTAGGNFTKIAAPNVAATTEAVSYAYGAGNAGTADWSSVEVSDTVASQLDVSTVSVAVPVAGGLADVWLTTKWGSDGVSGNSDDGVEFPIAVAASAASVGSMPVRSGTFPNGHASLPAGDWVTGFRARFGAVPVGGGATLVSLGTRLLVTDHDGNAVLGGAVIGTTATLRVVTATGNLERTATAPLTVREQIPTVTTRFEGGGGLGVGVLTSDVTLRGNASSFPWREPVLVIITPPSVSLDLNTVTPTAGNSSLAGRTVTTVPNWPGAGYGPGWTLYRFTFAGGQSVPAGQGYALNVRAVLAETAFGNLQIDGFTSSAGAPILIDTNFWGSGIDVDDKDADGDTGEVLGKWGARIQVARSVSATLIQAVKGAWDSTYQAAPATGTSRPGSADSYRLRLKNSGTVQLDGGVVIDVLPRPGDTNVLSAGPRNPATGTFPVLLAGAPVVPVLASPVTVSYSTAANPCRVELGYSPGGCTDPAWSSTPPPDLATVSAVKFDFGLNVLEPGRTWDVEVPVTTPISGATEPDFATVNPSPTRPADNEVAYNSSGFVMKEAGTATFLSAAEALKVGLTMPSVLGPPGGAPTAADLTSTGVGAVPHTVATAVPTLGTATLLDGSTPVTTLTVAGEGRYDVDGNGVLTFTPASGFRGTASGATYQLTDGFGRTARGTYRPTVQLPAPPRAVPVAWEGPQDALVAMTLPIPAGTGVALVGVDGEDVTTLTVRGEGTYTLDPDTDVVTFVRADGFTGATTPVRYRLRDAYGQESEAAITVNVLPAPVATARTSVGIGTAPQTVTLTAPDGGTLSLLGSDGRPVTSVTVSGEGTYRLNLTTGLVTFTPVLGFRGAATPVAYRLTGADAQSSSAVYTPTVLPPAAPTPAPVVLGGGTATAQQVAAITVPTGGTAHLVGSGGQNVTVLVVPGQGTYTVGPQTGVVTFAPVFGFHGLTTPIQYRVTDAYRQSGTSTVSGTVTRPAAPPSEPTDTKGGGTSTQTIVLSVPPGGSVTLFDAAGARVTRLVVTGEGVYQLTAEGVLTFTAELAFHGTATAVQYGVTDAYGQLAVGTLTLTVDARSLPRAPAPSASPSADSTDTSASAKPARLAATGSNMASLIPLSLVFCALGLALARLGRQPRRT